MYIYIVYISTCSYIYREHFWKARDAGDMATTRGCTDGQSLSELVQKWRHEPTIAWFLKESTCAQQQARRSSGKLFEAVNCR